MKTFYKDNAKGLELKITERPLKDDFKIVDIVLLINNTVKRKLGWFIKNQDVLTRELFIERVHSIIYNEYGNSYHLDKGLLEQGLNDSRILNYYELHA